MKFSFIPLLETGVYAQTSKHSLFSDYHRDDDDLMNDTHKRIQNDGSDTIIMSVYKQVASALIH